MGEAGGWESRPRTEATRGIGGHREPCQTSADPSKGKAFRRRAVCSANRFQEDGRFSCPDDLTHAHRIVRGWIAEHKREQKQRAEEIRRQQGDEWAWSGPPIDDLTERDLYRFCVGSAIFEAVEEAGGRIKEAPIDGKVTFRIDRQDVECSIVEKLCKPLMKPVGDAAKWTAFPNDRLNSFHCTGFLRVKITSYLGRTAPDWFETRQKKINDWLPEIVGGIMGAGVTLGSVNVSA